jgi:hypothetical protein
MSNDFRIVPYNPTLHLVDVARLPDGTYFCGIQDISPVAEEGKQTILWKYGIPAKEELEEIVRPYAKISEDVLAQL